MRFFELQDYNNNEDNNLVFHQLWFDTIGDANPHMIVYDKSPYKLSLLQSVFMYDTIIFNYEYQRIREHNLPICEGIHSLFGHPHIVRAFIECDNIYDFCQESNFKISLNNFTVNNMQLIFELLRGN